MRFRSFSKADAKVRQIIQPCKSLEEKVSKKLIFHSIIEINQANSANYTTFFILIVWCWFVSNIRLVMPNNNIPLMLFYSFFILINNNKKRQSQQKSKKIFFIDYIPYYIYCRIKTLKERHTILLASSTWSMSQL